MIFQYNSDILLKKHNFIYNHLFSYNHTCYYVGMFSLTQVSRYVTSASRYHVHPRSDSTELAEAFQIVNAQ